jgi:parallel beta-helix repeat protein
MKKGVKFTFVGLALFILIYLIFFIPNGKSNPDTAVSNCSNLTTIGERYYLSGDILNNQIGTACINITATNITLDCQGHYIYSVMNYTGIFSNATNTTVKNCNITMGSGGDSGAIGIYFNKVSNGTILNNSISGNSSSGIYLLQSNYSSIINNSATSNSGYGIDVYSSSMNSVINNNGTASATSKYGFYIMYSSNNTFLNNTGAGLVGEGIHMGYSINNTLMGNIGAADSASGIYITSYSGNNTLINNTGISNSSYGILLTSYSGNNTLINNTGMSNDHSGIEIQTVNKLVITSNTGISNSSYGIELQTVNQTILTSNIGLSNASVGIYLYGFTNSTLINNMGISTFSAGINLNHSNGGGPPYVSGNTFINNTGMSNSSFGIYLYRFASNSTFINNTGISNYSAGFEVTDTCENNTFIGNIGNSINPNPGTDAIGIWFGPSGSNNNTLINNTGISNSEYGVGVSGKNNTLIHNLGMSNSSYGIYLSLTNSIVTNNIGMSNFSAGYFIQNCVNTTISNAISSNNVYGIYFFNTNSTTIINLTAKNDSLYGVFLVQNSWNNIITNSFIQLSNGSAFSLNNTLGAPQNNSFYNNYFNNSVQFSNLSTSSLNYFNTTKTLGTNIVGGNYLGGNYWAAPNGTGFSQTCTSSTDGICNTAYNFDGVNYDYLPLSCVENWICTLGTCINGQQTDTCIDTNLCQTYKSKPAEDGSIKTCSTDTGGHTAPTNQGGGGGVSFSQPLQNITSIKPVEIIINNSQMDLNSIKINVKKSISNSSITITKLETNNSILKSGLPIGLLYQAFEIESGVSNSEIFNATLNFKINKTWLAENNITFHSKGNGFWLVQNNIVGNIILYRNPEGVNAWLPLVTNFSSEDNQFYHFSAYSQGFSTFAIFFNKYDCLPNSARCDGSEVQLCLGNSTWLVTEHCADTCDNGKCAQGFLKSGQFKFLIVTIVVAMITLTIIVLVAKVRRRGYKPYSKF